MEESYDEGVANHIGPESCAFAHKGRGEALTIEVLSALAQKIALGLGLSRAELMGGGRRRNVVEGRNLVSYVAIRGYGTSLTQVGKGLNISVQSVLRGVDRGEQEFQKRGWAIEDFLQ